MKQNGKQAEVPGARFHAQYHTGFASSAPATLERPAADANLRGNMATTELFPLRRIGSRRHLAPRWAWFCAAAMLLAIAMAALSLSVAPRAVSVGLDQMLVGRRDDVAVRTGGLFSPAALAFHAERDLGGRIAAIVISDRPAHAVRMVVAMPAGMFVVAYVDPYTADVRGVTPGSATLQDVRRWVGEARFDAFAGPDLVAATDPYGFVVALLAAAGLDRPRERGAVVGGTNLVTPLDATLAASYCSATDASLVESAAPPITVDDAVDAVEAAGVQPPYALLLPTPSRRDFRAIALDAVTRPRAWRVPADTVLVDAKPAAVFAVAPVAP